MAQIHFFVYLPAQLMFDNEIHETIQHTVCRIKRRETFI